MNLYYKGTAVNNSGLEGLKVVSFTKKIDTDTDNIDLYYELSLGNYVDMDVNILNIETNIVFKEGGTYTLSSIWKSYTVTFTVHRRRSI